MPIPEPTRQLVAKLKQTALLLDAVATQAKSDKAFATANDAANTIWIAINRIEDLAQAIEDMAPTFHREPSDEQTDAKERARAFVRDLGYPDERERHTRDQNNQ